MNSCVIALDGGEIAAIRSLVYGSQEGGLVTGEGTGTRISLETCDLFGSTFDCVSCRDGCFISLASCRALGSVRGERPAARLWIAFSSN